MWQLDKWLNLIAIVWLSCLNGPTYPGLTFVRANPVSPKEEGLYSSSDDVIVLDRGNFGDRVYGKSMVWMIEFYNRWCGHCIKYAPTWKAFASDLKGWRRVVSIGAVDCSSQDNIEICREYDIDFYPSIKLFPPRYNPEKNKGMTKLLDSNQAGHLKIELLNYIVEPEFSTPATWPSLSPLRSMGDIWNEATDEHKFVVVVFEESGSLVGREVTLDVVDYPSFLVRWMVRKDVEKFGTFTYPSLFIINKDSSFQLLARGVGEAEKDRQTFVNKLLSLLHFKDSEGNRIRIGLEQGGANAGDSGNVVHFDQNQLGKGKEGEEKNTSPGVDLKSRPVRKGVHLQDLESALHYAFRQEVALCKTIDGPKLDALRNFVSVLAKFFPGRPQVCNFLRKLTDSLQQLEQPLTGESWVKMMDTLQDKTASLPDQIHWVGCKGSEPRFRGYPCSMWTLFHTLTVAAHQHTGSAVYALEVPLAIRGYMQYFFGCQQCSEHFLQMASSLEHEVHKPLDAVLWLWNAHNRANKRLHGDATEDPQHPKIQFPSSDDCPECHSVQNSSSQPYPGWEVSEVGVFLLKFYGKDGIIQDVVPEEEDGDESVKAPEDTGKHPRKNDLKKIRELRDQKKKQKLEQRLVAKDAEQDGETRTLPKWRKNEHRPHSDVIKESVRSRHLGDGWGLNKVDVGVCLVFYLTCAALILILYYHFIVNRRFRVPCKTWLPV